MDIKIKPRRFNIIYAEPKPINLIVALMWKLFPKTRPPLIRLRKVDPDSPEYEKAAFEEIIF